MRPRRSRPPSSRDTSPAQQSPLTPVGPAREWGRESALLLGARHPGFFPELAARRRRPSPSRFLSEQSDPSLASPARKSWLAQVWGGHIRALQPLFGSP